MLPHVHSQQRLSVGRDRILILGRRDLQMPALLVLHQPAPAAAFDAEQRRPELGFEPRETAPAFLQCGRELGVGGLLAAWRGSRREVFPEERVVDVAACVEADRDLQVELNDDVVGGGRGGLRFQGCVEVGDVGLMVLGVVQGHDLFRNVWSQGLQC